MGDLHIRDLCDLQQLVRWLIRARAAFVPTHPGRTTRTTGPRIKIAARRASMLFIFAYVDLFSLHRADVRAEFEAGKTSRGPGRRRPVQHPLRTRSPGGVARE